MEHAVLQAPAPGAVPQHPALHGNERRFERLGQRGREQQKIAVRHSGLNAERGLSVTEREAGVGAVERAQARRNVHGPFQNLAQVCSGLIFLDADLEEDAFGKQRVREHAPHMPGVPALRQGSGQLLVG